MIAATADAAPRPLAACLPDLRETLADARRLLLCLDFDGTLAPIVEDPAAATALPANAAAVERLAAEPTVTTAVISGRALSDVRDRIDGPSAYAGNHGLELAREGSVAIHPTARKRAKRVSAVCGALGTVLDAVPNARVENKRLTGTVHLRSVPSQARPVVRHVTTRLVDRLAGDRLKLSSGKQILEVEPAIPWGKGDAVALIAADHPPETATLYVGDDVTDESAFRTVEPEGAAIRVGDVPGDRPTAASYRVRNPGAVARFLQWLATRGIDALER